MFPLHQNECSILTLYVQGIRLIIMPEYIKALKDYHNLSKHISILILHNFLLLPTSIGIYYVVIFDEEPIPGQYNVVLMYGVVHNLIHLTV